jgi:hypothetical protein
LNHRYVVAGQPQKKSREILRSPGWANRHLGTGRLCNSNNGFMPPIAQAKREGRAIRRGALSDASNEIHVKVRRHLNVAGRGLSDDGARA